MLLSGLILSHVALVLCEPMVTVEQGILMGKMVKFENEYLGINKDIDVYLGIPYAEPPVGERRFTPPVHKEPWDEQVYDATYFRYMCMQIDPEDIQFPVSEDCLHLNIYAPKPKLSSVPVMVFIHGGNFLRGNGYSDYYGGYALAAIGDVIIVTLHYRLSTFGFLTTGDEVCPGNFGMLDQVEALRWINTNINAFGGDANRITIFGESFGGGSSVSAHLFSPLSEPLFYQAILQSGTSLDDWSVHEDLEEQREIAFKLGEEVGCSANNTNDLISCLRQIDAKDLIKASYQFQYNAAMCVDNTYLLELPRVSAKNESFKKCPLITGFNKDEAKMFILNYFPSSLKSPTAPHVSIKRFEKELHIILTGYGRYVNELIEGGFKQVYVDWSKVDDPEADYLEEWNNVLTDYWFSCAAIYEAKLHARAAVNDVYMYYFTHSPSLSFYIDPKWLGATHGEQRQFVFGYPFDPSPHLDFHQYPEEEANFSYQLIKYWTNFAKTGNPNKEDHSTPPYDDDKAWPAFTLPGLHYKELTPYLKTGRGLKANECHLWNEYLETLNKFTGIFR